MKQAVKAYPERGDARSTGEDEPKAAESAVPTTSSSQKKKKKKKAGAPASQAVQAAKNFISNNNLTGNITLENGKDAENSEKIMKFVSSQPGKVAWKLLRTWNNTAQEGEKIDEDKILEQAKNNILHYFNTTVTSPLYGNIARWEIYSQNFNGIKNFLNNNKPENYLKLHANGSIDDSGSEHDIPFYCVLLELKDDYEKINCLVGGEIAQSAFEIDGKISDISELYEAFLKAGTVNFGAIMDNVLEGLEIVGSEKALRENVLEFIENTEEEKNLYIEFGGRTDNTSFNNIIDILQEAEQLLTYSQNLDYNTIETTIDDREEQFEAIELKAQDNKLTPPMGGVNNFLKGLADEVSELLSVMQSELSELKQVSGKTKNIDELIATQQGLASYITQASGLDDEQKIPILQSIKKKQQSQAGKFIPSPNLQHKLRAKRIASLKKKNQTYAELIEQLLTQYQTNLLDESNLDAELISPVEQSKYRSRIMELEYLVNAIKHNSAVKVQVGKLKKDELVKGLKAAGHTASADRINSSQVNSFQADGIIYIADYTIEAIQHKTSITSNPFEQRQHASHELSRPEFERQLEGAVNQLAGRTAAGNQLNKWGGTPETPPPMSKKIANVFFPHVQFNDDDLDKYNRTLASVLGDKIDRNKGERYKYVDEIIVTFQNDRKLVYQSNKTAEKINDGSLRIYIDNNKQPENISVTH